MSEFSNEHGFDPVVEFFETDNGREFTALDAYFGSRIIYHITRDLAPKKTNQAETYSAQRRQSPFRYKLALPRDLREPS